MAKHFLYAYSETAALVSSGRAGRRKGRTALCGRLLLFL